MNLYLFELKSSRKSLIIWIFSILGIFIFSMSMFPSFSANAGAVDEMLANFSPEMLKALGMDIIDFSKPMDYLAYMFQYILVAVGALGILSGGTIIAKEEADRTIEFLYARPVGRYYIALSKIAATLTNMFITAACFYISTILTMKFITTTVDYGAIFNISLALLLFMLLFTSIGLILGHFFVKSSKRLPVGLGLLFFMYFISIMADVSEQFKVFKYFTPFKYFSGIDLIYNGFSSLYLLITGLIIIICVITTAILYQNKDLNG